MDALFLFHKSSVSGSIPNLSLTSDAQHNPYPFLMAATPIIVHFLLGIFCMLAFTILIFHF